MTKDLLQIVQARLEEWAEVYSSGNFYGLGFLKYSLEYRLQRDGFLTRNPHRVEPAISTTAEEIENWVCEMYRQNPVMADALRHYYFASGSLRQKAKHCSISHTQFKYQVDLAHQWLIGRLSAIRSQK